LSIGPRKVVKREWNGTYSVIKDIPEEPRRSSKKDTKMRLLILWVLGVLLLISLVLVTVLSFVVFNVIVGALYGFRSFWRSCSRVYAWNGMVGTGLVGLCMQCVGVVSVR